MFPFPFGIDDLQRTEADTTFCLASRACFYYGIPFKKKKNSLTLLELAHLTNDSVKH